MLDMKQVDEMAESGRIIEVAKEGDKQLGPLNLLPGKWANVPNLPGRGWNMIALPFATEPKTPFNYRLLLNQYNEELEFTIVDKAVPNRGIRQYGQSTEDDQFLATLEYTQSITQIAADDFPESGEAGGPNLPIHREPGLWLHMANNVTEGLDIARLGTIPHGDSVMALGRAFEKAGAPNIPVISGLPIGVSDELSSPYLAPYEHFHRNLFENLFDPTIPNQLLEEANKGVDIVHTTELHVDTEFDTGGIVNIPFVTKQANASQMHSTFWIQQLKEKQKDGTPKLRLQYTQTVFLDFFPRPDGQPGLIRWPHISINTLEKVED